MGELILSEEQKKIVENEIFPVYLCGSAGCGKTEIIIEKIIRLIENGISLNNIAVISFSAKESFIFKEKLRKRIIEKLKNEFSVFFKFQLEIFDDSPIFTAYEFSKQLINRFETGINISSASDIKSFQVLMKDIIENEISVRSESEILTKASAYALRKMTFDFIKYCSDNYIQPISEILDNISHDDNTVFWNDFKSEFIAICKESTLQIETLKQEENIYDQNDCLKKMLELLEDNTISKLISDEFKYLFIENFQDANSCQIKIVKKLIEAGVNVFLSADEQQSIHSFKGANIDDSFNIDKILNITETPFLNDNHRSDGKLIYELNKIFSTDFAVNGNKINFPYKELKIPPDKNGTGLNKCFNITYEKNISSIIKDVMKTNINGKEVKYEDIAVLCRRGYDISLAAKELKKSGIPFEIVAKKGFYSGDEIIDTYKIFNAIINKEKIYKKEIKSTVYYKCFTVNKKDNDFWDFFAELESLFRFGAFDEALNYLFEETSILEYLDTMKKYQAKSNLIKLKEKIFLLLEDENKTSLQIYNYLKSMIKSNKIEEDAPISEKDKQNGLVRLFLIHNAYFLDFPVVIIPNIDMRLNRKNLAPNFILEHNESTYKLSFNSASLNINRNYDKEYTKMYKIHLQRYIEEEIRLFYVACTRAKNILILSSTKSYDDFLKSFSWEDYISIPKLLESKYMPD